MTMGASIHDRKFLLANSVITAWLHFGKVHTEYPFSFKNFSVFEYSASGRAHPVIYRNSFAGTYI